MSWVYVIANNINSLTDKKVDDAYLLVVKNFIAK